MKAGWKVKIPDIGPFATVVHDGKHIVKLELEGEQLCTPESLKVEILESAICM